MLDFLMADIAWSSILDDSLGSFTLAELPPTLELPALPHAVTQFTEKAGQDEVDLLELAKIVETDNGLTVELLRHVNSTYVGLRNKAKNVHQAMSMLGLRQTKNFVITTGMRGAVQSRQSKLINQSSFWNANLQKALFAREIAKLLKTDEDVAFSGALLQDFLLPVLSNDLMNEYMQFIQTREQQTQGLPEFEQAVFGWDHALAGACLARRWKLPDELVCCMLTHHFGLRILSHEVLGRSPAAAVALSAMLPDQLRQSRLGLDLLQRLQTKWKAFDLVTIAERVDALHEENAMGVKNDFPLARRCQAAANSADAYADGTLTRLAS